MDTILPVNPIEAILEDASGEIQSGSTAEVVLALSNIPGEVDLIDIGEVFMLDYQKPSPIDIWLDTI